MATTRAEALESIDVQGMSIVSSLMTADAPRQGTIYNPVTLAAGVPVYFHPAPSGTGYLAVFRTRWRDAVMGAAGPQSYSSYEISDVPSWVHVSPSTGRVGPVQDLPTPQPYELAGAIGRGAYLWTTGQDIDGNAVVEMYRVTATMLLPTGQEVIPPINGVQFGMGCWLDEYALMVFGTDEEDKLYAARKNWARIGVRNAADGPWTYHGAKGWYPDPDFLEPLGPTTTGPVSVARYQSKLWLTTVATHDDGKRDAQLHTGTGFASWTPVGALTELGDEDTYLGGGMYLQPQLNANMALAPTGSAVPYVTSVLLPGSEESAINTTWNLCLLTR